MPPSREKKKMLGKFHVACVGLPVDVLFQAHLFGSFQSSRAFLCSI